MYFAHAELVPLGIGYRPKGQKTRMIGLLGRERKLRISSAIWIQHDGQMDGHWRQQRLHLRIALHGKNYLVPGT